MQTLCEGILNCPCLKALHLAETILDRVPVEALGQAAFKFPQLIWLNLDRNPIVGECLESLLQNPCAKLEILQLSDCYCGVNGGSALAAS